MESKQLEVIKDFEQLKDIWQVGDTVLLTTIPYTEDTIIVNNPTELINGEIVEIEGSKVVAKKGSMKSYILTAPDGQEYSESSINGAIGPKALSEIFKIKT